MVSETSSTNDAVRQLVAQGVAPPVWLRAETQTAGRGRRGRSWRGQPGNLFLSGLVQCDRPLAEVAQLSFVAGLAVIDAVADLVTPHQLKAKWPNDVLLNGAKLAGVLLETERHDGKVRVIVGVGVNVTTAPTGLDQPATALTDHVRPEAPTPSAHDVAETVVGAFMRRMDAWLTDGFEPVRQEWLAHSFGIGERVRTTRQTHQGTQTLAGLFETLDADGALVIRSDGGERVRVTAGEAIFDISAAVPSQPAAQTD